ncbi:MAG: hypothetical protein ACLGGX_06530 [Bdellovibrionia bacterium]
MNALIKVLFLQILLVTQVNAQTSPSIEAEPTTAAPQEVAPTDSDMSDELEEEPPSAPVVAETPAVEDLTNVKGKPLYFQVDKNNVQVLAQRFEYTQIDQQNLRIGDVIIDSSRFGFQVSRNKKNALAIKFVWPAGLLTEGQIVIRDNAGKALFNTTIDTKKLKIVKGSGTDAEIRSERAELIVRNITPDLVKRMQAQPYMQLCLFQLTENTRIYLCSQDVYLTQQNNKFRVLARSTSKKQAFVQVNGKEVGPQGIIFLNDPEETLSFQSQSESGASLEIVTQMRPVDFKDVIQGANEDEILMISSGAEPANKNIAKKLKNGDWQISLNAKRPVLFLKGEGGIPLRQEFFIKGSLPRSEFRPFLDNDSPEKTYKSSLLLEGEAAADWQLSPAQPDSQVQTQTKDSRKFRWILNKIPAGKKTRHYISVNRGNEKFIAAYDLLKANPYVLSGHATYANPANALSGAVDFQWWFEEFLGQNSALTTYRWGFEAGVESTLVKKTQDANITTLRAALHYRLKTGFHLIDPSHRLSLLVSQRQIESESLMTLGFGYQHQTLVPELSKTFSRWLKWWHNSIEFYLPNKSQNLELETALTLKTEALSPLNETLFLKSHLGYEIFKVKDAKSEDQLQVGLGILWQF